MQRSSEQGIARRSQRIASAAIVLGLSVVVAWISFVAFTFVTGDWPEISL